MDVQYVAKKNSIKQNLDCQTRTHTGEQPYGCTKSGLSHKNTHRGATIWMYKIRIVTQDHTQGSNHMDVQYVAGNFHENDS